MSGLSKEHEGNMECYEHLLEIKEHPVALLAYLILLSESWTVTSELQRRIQTLVMICCRIIIDISR